MKGEWKPRRDKFPENLCGWKEESDECSLDVFQTKYNLSDPFLMFKKGKGQVRYFEDTSELQRMARRVIRQNGAKPRRREKTFLESTYHKESTTFNFE